ncbi:MAG: tetratricopeptide repeat protein [Desulfovibrionaceae bacterium]|nr:tetratricopeptide repeat protein [Desulfovibrionaceae bacterium]
MNEISLLLKVLPSIPQCRMVSSGFGLWLCWPGTLNPAVINTIKDYGAMSMVEEPNQSLWFFPTSDIFRALARLDIWAKLNPMPLFCQVLPVSLLVGHDLSLSLSVPAELSLQRMENIEGFEIYIHPKLKEDLATVSGLSLEPAPGLPGLASTHWARLLIDQGLDYESTLKWFFVLRPVGKLKDKESIVGWRDFFSDIQTLLQRMRLKYISEVKEGFVIFALDSIRLLRTFCREILGLVRQGKEGKGTHYWPCVMAVTPQKDLPFSEQLPGKMNLEWNRLSPDYPHLQYRDAFLLGEWFKINDIHRGADQESLETWCSIGLKAGEEQPALVILEVSLPRRLVSGELTECFYCGQKTHAPPQCPTRRFKDLRPDVWRSVAGLSMKEFSKGFFKLDELMESKDLAEIYENNTGKEGMLLRAVMEIDSINQVRALKDVWHSRGKEWPEGITQLAGEESVFLMPALSALITGDLADAGELLKQAAFKHPRSFQPQSLHGFVALEAGDLNQARFYWEEAERLSYTPLQKNYFQFLRARLMECEGEFREASEMYRTIYNSALRWLEPLYRQGVCLVKMGFTGQAIDLFSELMIRDPNLFNRILIDPELDRGRVQIMNSMLDKWSAAQEQVEANTIRLENLSADINQRFEENHRFFESSHEELENLRTLTKVKNFVAYQELALGVQTFEDKLEQEVGQEIRAINRRVDGLFETLKSVQREAAWFPFPRFLHDFNRDFNFCVEKINWIKAQHLKIADNFRRTLHYLKEIDGHIDELRKRLVSLRIVRDTTLFALVMGKSFIWFELVGLGLALVSLPAFVYLTKGVEHNWMVDLVRSQKWAFQKAVILILSILALAFAAVKSAITFDRRKRDLFEQFDREAEERKQARKKAFLEKSKAKGRR